MKKELDVIIIPTGSCGESLRRAEAALKSFGKLSEHGYFVISGHHHKGSLRAIEEGTDYLIYKYLRDKGVPPTRILIEGRSHDTRENTVYSLKKIKQRAEHEQSSSGTINVGVATYRDHFKRFKEFHKKCVEKGLFEDGLFKLHGVFTKETSKDKKYEHDPLRRLFNKFKLATIGKYRGKRGGVKKVPRDEISKLAEEVKAMVDS